MEQFYFTFGSSKQFPYQNGYLVVEARNMNDAFRTFREKYPDVNEGCVNCAFVYSKAEWVNGICKYYEKQVPKEILFSDAAKVKRMSVLLENTMGMLLETMSVGELLKEIGTSEEELQKLGVEYDY